MGHKKKKRKRTLFREKKKGRAPVPGGRNYFPKASSREKKGGKEQGERELNTRIKKRKERGW